jgi:tRNA threonylcarbamoyladenosine biosynthesis protein TsaE
VTGGPALRRIEREADGPEATRALGHALGEALADAPGGSVVLLAGALGAGKTVFVQGLARGLGVTTPVKSPTFALEHRHEGRRALHHLDLYRLTPGRGLEELGLDELAAGPDVVAIEWPDRLPDPPADAVRVTLDWPAGAGAESERRIVRIEGPAARLDPLAANEAPR